MKHARCNRCNSVYWYVGHPHKWCPRCQVKEGGRMWRVTMLNLSEEPVVPTRLQTMCLVDYVAYQKRQI